MLSILRQVSGQANRYEPCLSSIKNLVLDGQLSLKWSPTSIFSIYLDPKTQSKTSSTVACESLPENSIKLTNSPIPNFENK